MIKVFSFKLWCCILIFAFLVLRFLPVFAEGLVPCGGTGQKPCRLIDIFVLIQTVMNWLLLYGGIFATLFIAGGGIMMLISRGNPGQISKAKMWITYAVIGLLLVFVAWVIINTIFIILGFPSAEFKSRWPWDIKWGEEQWGTPPQP